MRDLAEEAPPDTTALSRLIPPAGLALALHTGAYRPTAPTDDDPYTVRARWLDALAAVPPTTARKLPPLSTLVKQTLAADDRGNRLRIWLAGPHATGLGARTNAADALALLARDQASC